MGFIPYRGQLRFSRVVKEKGKAFLKICILLCAVKKTHIHSYSQSVLRRPLFCSSSHGRNAVFYDLSLIKQVSIRGDQIQAGLVQDNILKRKGKVPVKPRVKGGARTLGSVVLKITYLKSGSGTHVTPGKIIDPTPRWYQGE